MKNIFLLPFFLLFLTGLGAQRPYAKLVVGIETAYDLQLYDEGRRPKPIPDVHVEFPYHDFSFGFGFAYKKYGKTYYDTVLPELVTLNFSGEDKQFYQMEYRQVSPAYFSVPLHVNYRFLPCKCLYLYGGMSFDFKNPKVSEKVLGQSWSDTRPTWLFSGSRFKNNYKTYEIGLGFKLHASDVFRFVGRPSIVWTENPENVGPSVVRSLRFTLGMQYAFVRYGGRF